MLRAATDARAPSTAHDGSSGGTEDAAGVPLIVFGADDAAVPRWPAPAGAQTSDDAAFTALCGGKAAGLRRLERALQADTHASAVVVPPWFCLTTAALAQLVQHRDALAARLMRAHLAAPGIILARPADAAAAATVAGDTLDDLAGRIAASIHAATLPEPLAQAIDAALDRLCGGARDNTVALAVRSSAADEDAEAGSQAGLYESYLGLRTRAQVLDAIRRCWASGFSARAMQSRAERGLFLCDATMAVIVQVMVLSAQSGVAFSRHPLKPMHVPRLVLVEAVFGLGEGLVQGTIPADRYEIAERTCDETADSAGAAGVATLAVVSRAVASKAQAVLPDESGVRLVDRPAEQQRMAALSDAEAVRVAQTVLVLERALGTPQDLEWALNGDGQLFALQTRRIVTLPPNAFFGLPYSPVLGSRAVLWDNSNIVESYSGVTTPLTFSFASRAYHVVYTCALRVAGVPDSVVRACEPYLSNMLGLVRGRVYYNLLNWYRCLACVPIGNSRARFMETMMGVRQRLDPELEARVGAIDKAVPKYSIVRRLLVLWRTLRAVWRIDTLAADFMRDFDAFFESARHVDFSAMDLVAQMAYARRLESEVLAHWDTPIINDTYVMLFFGLLKKLVDERMGQTTTTGATRDDRAASLQNDLLCGQGDVQSTEPTKALMRIAARVDADARLRDWLIAHGAEVLACVRRARARRYPATDDGREWCANRIADYLDQFGFRCPDELKLEAPTYEDDPALVIDFIASYVRTQKYSIEAMEDRERAIRTDAERVVATWPGRVRRYLFFWVLSHARRGVRHRENLRFARTKLFAIYRRLFRAVGANLVALGLLAARDDVFMLTLDELYALADGRSVSHQLSGVVAVRRREFEQFRRGAAPPQRLLMHGACGPYMLYPHVLDNLDLLRDADADAGDGARTLRGIPCCPGVVQGVVRVVRSMDEARGLNGEILVTERTDPGWVPLYPLCSGLLIERGSLLSHSAVVARELGLPTIVGISGGLLEQLRTGMRVHVDAGAGIVRLLGDPNRSDVEH